MKIVKSNKRQPTASFIGAILTIGFGVFWTLMVHHFISIVGGFGPMGIMFPLIGVFFITVGVVQATIYLMSINRDDFHSDNSEYFRRTLNQKFDFDLTGKFENLTQKYWGDSKEENNHIDCKHCNSSYDKNFMYCPKCGKSKNE